MQAKIDKVQTSPTGYQHVTGTLTMPDMDADLTVKLPSGAVVELQWRVDGPSLDVCFDQGVVCYNQALDMEPAPVEDPKRPERHSNVHQLTLMAKGWRFLPEHRWAS